MNNIEDNLRPFQLTSAKNFASSTHKTGVLAWETGLGKTRTALYSAYHYITANLNNFKHTPNELSSVLIIAPPIIISQYQKELKALYGDELTTFTTPTPHATVSYLTIAALNWGNGKAITFYLYNMNVANSKVEVDKMLAREYSFSILDEFQLFKAKNTNADCGTASIGAVSFPTYLSSDKILFLTATPFTNNHDDIVSFLELYRAGELSPIISKMIKTLLHKYNNPKLSPNTRSNRYLEFTLLAQKTKSIFDFKTKNLIQGTPFNIKFGSIDPIPGNDRYLYMLLNDNTNASTKFITNNSNTEANISAHTSKTIEQVVNCIHNECSLTKYHELGDRETLLLSPKEDQSFLDTFAGLRFLATKITHTKSGPKLPLSSVFFSGFIVLGAPYCTEFMPAHTTESASNLPTYDQRWLYILSAWNNILNGEEISYEELNSYLTSLPTPTNPLHDTRIEKATLVSDHLNLITLIDLYNKDLEEIAGECYKNPIVISSFLGAFIFCLKCLNTSKYNAEANELISSMCKNGYIHYKLFKLLTERGYLLDFDCFDTTAFQRADVINSFFVSGENIQWLEKTVNTIATKQGLNTDMYIYTYYIEILRKHHVSSRIAHEYIINLLEILNIDNVPESIAMLDHHEILHPFRGLVLFHSTLVRPTARKNELAHILKDCNILTFKLSDDSKDDLETSTTRLYKEYISHIITNNFPPVTNVLITLYSSLATGFNLHNWRFSIGLEASDLAAHLVQALGRSFRNDSILNSYGFICTDLVSEDYMKHLRAIQLFRASLPFYHDDGSRISNLASHITVPGAKSQIKQSKKTSNVFYEQIIQKWSNTIANIDDHQSFRYTNSIQDIANPPRPCFGDFALNWNIDKNVSDDPSKENPPPVLNPSLYDGFLFKQMVADSFSAFTDSRLKYSIVNRFLSRNVTPIPYNSLLYHNPLRYIEAKGTFNNEFDHNQLIITLHDLKYPANVDPDEEEKYLRFKDLWKVSPSSIPFYIQNSEGVGVYKAPYDSFLMKRSKTINISE